MSRGDRQRGSADSWCPILAIAAPSTLSGRRRTTRIRHVTEKAGSEAAEPVEPAREDVKRPAAPDQPASPYDHEVSLRDFSLELRPSQLRERAQRTEERSG